MATLVHGGYNFFSYSRPLTRSSSGDLHYVGAEANSTTGNDALVEVTSTDDGSSWSSSFVSPEHTYDSQNNHDSAIDSNDVIHACCKHQSNNEITYAQWPAGLMGTANVTGEVVYSNSNGVTTCAIGVNSADTVYVAVTYGNKSMGSTYDNQRLLRRDGAGSWTDLGAYASGQTNYYYPSIAMDGQDRIHLTYIGGGPKWNRYDPGSTAFIGQESFGSYGGYTPCLTNSSDEPIATYLPDADGSFTADSVNIAERSSGSWTTERVSHQIDGDWYGTLARAGGDLYVPFTEGDLYENHASSVGNFDPANATTLYSTSDTLTEVSTRWQRYNENDPSSDKVDILVWNNTTSEIYYETVMLSKSVTETLTAGVGTAPTDHTSKRARRTARALMETGGE